MNIIRGLKTVSSEMPLDFMAVSSTCSPRLPNVMSEASKMASGKASGTIVRAA